MKKYFILLAVALSAGASAYSQTTTAVAFEDWADKPKQHAVHAMFDSSGAIGILTDKKVEYKSEGDNIFVYTTIHDIVKVKSDKGIEMFNKVYIYMYPNSEVNNIKARTILSSGKVINVDASKVKEIEEEGSKYKLFAMEGVEKDAEIEYTYTIKRGLSIFGSMVFQEGNMPYQQALFTLATPKHLKFTVKGYNGFNINSDTVLNEQRIITASATDIPQLDDEKYGYREQYLKRVDYKLSYNLTNSESVRMYTWKEFAKKAYSFYTERSEKEDKAVNNFVKQIDLSNASDEAAKISRIEDFVKTNINVNKDLISNDADALEKIVKNKAANDEGITKLFSALFDKFNIQYQIVCASDRNKYPLDEELENWNRVESILFFFPSTQKFIAPANIELRYPYIPANLAASKGLFLKGTTIGNFKTAIGSFNDVALEPFEQSAQNMEADLKFDESLDTILVKSSQVLKGYPAAELRPVYVLLPKDKQDEITKDIIKNVANSTNISNIKIENTTLTDCLNNKPLIISADIKSTELIEHAGNKILLKIGEVIGQQEQMYQEKPRQMPAEIEYPHVLNRNVTLHIPDGYIVKNAKDLNINVTHQQDGETDLGFQSSFVQSTNTITITINETYKKVLYPLDQFNEFKNVINAAADFNKVVLVLEKKM